MNRCDHCEMRNGWICGDGWNRTSDTEYCEDFRLDFDTLDDDRKRDIQIDLMEGGEWT